MSTLVFTLVFQICCICLITLTPISLASAAAVITEGRATRGTVNYGPSIFIHHYYKQQESKQLPLQQLLQQKQKQAQQKPEQSKQEEEVEQQQPLEFNTYIKPIINSIDNTNTDNDMDNDNHNDVVDNNVDNKNSLATRYKYQTDNYDYRYPDGSYEYRYELTDGTIRYEKGYFIHLNGCKVLVVLGYYAYRLPNGQYVTVFYNADHNGYRQQQEIRHHSYPSLPRSIDVPTARASSPTETDLLSTTAKTSTIIANELS